MVQAAEPGSELNREPGRAFAASCIDASVQRFSDKRPDGAGRLEFELAWLLALPGSTGRNPFG